MTPIPAVRSRATVLDGWALLLWIAAALAVLVALVFSVHGAGEAGLRTLIRDTARFSLTLFLIVFTASAVNRLRGSRLSRWVLRNRRYLGVALFLSQLVHGYAIIALARHLGPAFKRDLSVLGSGGGGLGYLLLLLMTITSFDSTTRWLGRRKWKLLHTFGMYFLWVVFVVTYAPRVAAAPMAVIPVLLLLAALGVRIAAARARAHARA